MDQKMADATYSGVATAMANLQNAPYLSFYILTYSHFSNNCLNPSTCFFLLSLEEELFVRILHSIDYSRLPHNAGEPPSFSPQTCKPHYSSNQMKLHRCCLLEPSTHNLQ